VHPNREKWLETYLPPKANGSDNKAGGTQQELVSMVIHDLKTPLGVILASMELLSGDMGEGLSAEQQDLIRGAARSVQQILQLVANLLEVQHLEAGRMPIRRQPVDLDQILQEAVDQIRLLADWKDVDLDLSLAGNLPWVLADADLTRRVVTNLLDNALRYTPRRGRIGVAAWANGREVTVSVADGGPGIPTEGQRQIFESYYQATSSSRNGDLCVGLGLAFCKQAMEAQGGRIWLEEGVGQQGAEFRFSLPAWQEQGRA
jgi:signal transduction histidine kinase